MVLAASITTGLSVRLNGRAPPRCLGHRSGADDHAMSVVAWIAFGTIAGYTVVGMVPVDDELGARGHIALGSAGALVAGFLASVLFGVDPLSARIDMLTVTLALLGAIVAIVAWNEKRGPLARRRGF